MINFNEIIKSPVSLFIQGSSKIQRSLMCRKKNIYISCFPKSGSSYVTRTLSNLTKTKIHRVNYQFLQNEQEIYLPSLIDANLFKRFLTQQHTRATDPNIKLLNNYKIKPIILVRNIYDIVISLRDYILVAPKMPMAYVTEDIRRLTEVEQYDFVIDHMLPWYFNFYVSWYKAESENKIEFLWTSYEKMLEDKFSFFREILEFLSFKISDNKIMEEMNNIDKKNDKFNRGLKGRGDKLLSKNQKEKIIQFSKYYNSVDFSLIGISK